MTDSADSILSRLPARLKEARQAQGLSLDAISKLSGVSRSMVSQIERGESSPTIATLWNLTRALQVDFAGLLDTGGEAARIEVVRREALPTIDNLGRACRIRILSPPEEAGKHELYQIELGPDGVLDSQPHGHGAKELLTVVSGAVAVRSGEAERRVGEGDTARYAADVAHAIRAVDGAAVVLLVVQEAG